jgi:hypothetical protein
MPVAMSRSDQAMRVAGVSREKPYVTTARCLPAKGSPVGRWPSGRLAGAQARDAPARGSSSGMDPGGAFRTGRVPAGCCP